MINDIKSTLLNLTRNVTKQSSELVKATKLTVSLSQEQEALKNLYTEIGKKVHEIYQYGGSLGKFFDEKYREIEEAERKIEALRDEVAKIRGVKDCPKCGKQVDKAAEFCPRCGMKLDGAIAAGDGGAVLTSAGTSTGYIPPGTSAGAAGSAYPGVTAPPVETAYPGATASTMESVYPGTSAPTAESVYPGTPAPAAESAYPGTPAPTAESAYPGTPAPIPEIPSPVPEIIAAPTAQIICRVCGTANDAGTKFCLSCGRYL